MSTTFLPASPSLNLIRTAMIVMMKMATMVTFFLAAILASFGSHGLFASRSGCTHHMTSRQSMHGSARRLVDNPVNLVFQAVEIAVYGGRRPLHVTTKHQQKHRYTINIIKSTFVSTICLSDYLTAPHPSGPIGRLSPRLQATTTNFRSIDLPEATLILMAEARGEIRSSLTVPPDRWHDTLTLQTGAAGQWLLTFE